MIARIKCWKCGRKRQLPDFEASSRPCCRRSDPRPSGADVDAGRRGQAARHRRDRPDPASCRRRDTSRPETAAARACRGVRTDPAGPPRSRAAVPLCRSHSAPFATRSLHLQCQSRALTPTVHMGSSTPFTQRSSAAGWPRPWMWRARRDRSVEVRRPFSASAVDRRVVDAGRRAPASRLSEAIGPGMPPQAAKARRSDSIHCRSFATGSPRQMFRLTRPRRRKVDRHAPLWSRGKDIDGAPALSTIDPRRCLISEPPYSQDRR